MAKTKADAGSPVPTPKLDLPSWEAILQAKGMSVEEAERRLSGLVANFPYGIPDQVLYDWINSTFDTANIAATLLDVARAFEVVRRTGKGPVGPVTGSELA